MDKAAAGTLSLTSSTTTTILLFTTIFGISYYIFTRRKKLPPPVIAGDKTIYRHPPCLPTVPILGSLPFLPAFPNMYKFFTKNMDGYGYVVAYYLMGDYKVILSSKEAIHEAFVKRSTDFANRSTAKVNNVLNPEQKGIMFHNYDDNFRHYHKLSLGIMKQFGFGNRIMERRIMEEVEFFMENLASFKGSDFNPTPVVAKCSMNIVCGILFGRRFHDDDPDLAGIIGNIRTSFNNLGKIFIVNVFPFLKYFSFHKRAIQNCVDAQDKIFKMLEQKIAECTAGMEFDEIEDEDAKETKSSSAASGKKNKKKVNNNYDYDGDDDDGYVEQEYDHQPLNYPQKQQHPQQQQQQQLHQDAPQHSFIRSYIEQEGPNYDKKQLLHFMHELFLAGTETTASTLEWTLVLLANNRDVQEKMYSELENVLSGRFGGDKNDPGKTGNGDGDEPAKSLGEMESLKEVMDKIVRNTRQKMVNHKTVVPSLEDKKNLLYCDAVFHEILRYKAVAPMTLPHEAMRDSHVMGFFIPAKTTVIGNLHGAHYDPHVWKEPEVFNPERFIDEETGNLINREHIIPFSLGKRSCFGEILARQEFFLSLTNLVWRFKIFPPKGQDEVKVDDVMDVTAKPSPFKIRLVERN